MFWIDEKSRTAEEKKQNWKDIYKMFTDWSTVMQPTKYRYRYIYLYTHRLTACLLDYRVFFINNGQNIFEDDKDKEVFKEGGGTFINSDGK